MRRSLPFIFYISCLIPGTFSFASDYPKVDADLKAFDQHVTEMNVGFEKIPSIPKDKEWVKKKLQQMVDVDQYMRNSWNIPFDHQYTEAEKKEFQKQFESRSSSIDSDNTLELKKLLKIYRWFTVSSFGAQADRNAWLLVQHADLDISFQKEVLIVLSELFPKRETQPANYAYLFDRVATSPHDPSQRKLQRYGTQGTCVGPGKWEPFPVEDPTRLDERRKEVGLESEAEYLKRFKTICH